VSHRAKVINGVAHGRRCCCPACDPDDLLTAQVLAEARARPAPTIVPTVAQVLRAVRILPAPVRNLLSVSESDDTKRFRELLREGLTAAEALTRIEIEKGTAT
jgi:uncharacterized protein (DUF2236 family)